MGMGELQYILLLSRAAVLQVTLTGMVAKAVR